MYELTIVFHQRVFTWRVRYAPQIERDHERGGFRDPMVYRETVEGEDDHTAINWSSVEALSYRRI